MTTRTTMKIPALHKKRGKSLMNKRLFVVLLCLLFFVPFSSAVKVISNSQDWRDVYSVMLYSNLRGDAGAFLVSQRHASLILNSIPRGTQIQVFSSPTRPYIVGYESFLESRGYPATEELLDNINLELARRLENVSSYIIIDDSYGYNAVSVAPYAVVSKSYVIFADRNNIDDVDAFFAERPPKKLIIYGIVDREVRNALAQYNPEIINFDGDRFKNNIAIVKKYQQIAPKKQVILTNGEFIEQEIMSGLEPVLFLGQQNVPDEIRKYIRDESGFEVAVLIGNQYVGSATAIRRATGVSVFVKFAQSARAPQGAINPVEGLDMFFVPQIILNLELFSVEYNEATGMLEVTLKNNVEQATYFKGTYTVKDQNSSQTVGDVEPVFLDGNSLITLTYPIDPVSGNALVEAFIVYGESKFSLERTIDGTFNVSVIKVLDESKLEIIGAYYDLPNKRFVVTIKNTGSVELFADVIIRDIKIDGIVQQIGTGKEPLKISPGKKAKVFIDADLAEEDIRANPRIRVVARYGQRAAGLVKKAEAEMELKVKRVDIVYYGLILAIVILFLVIIFTRKKKCRHCKHKNPRRRKTCEKCGEKLD